MSLNDSNAFEIGGFLSLLIVVPFFDRKPRTVGPCKT